MFQYGRLIVFDCRNSALPSHCLAGSYSTSALQRITADCHIDGKLPRNNRLRAAPGLSVGASLQRENVSSYAPADCMTNFVYLQHMK
jgi:hypothetical protein